MLDTQPDTTRQIPTIRVVTNLVATSQNVKRVLSLKHLLHKIRHYMRHGKPDVSAHDLPFTDSALFVNSDAIKRSHNCIRKLVLLVGTLNEVL